MNHDEQQQHPEWMNDDDHGDRITPPDLHPGPVLLTITIIGVILSMICLALSGCADWQCRPAVSVNMAPPTMGGDGARITSYGFGVHCEQKGGE